MFGAYWNYCQISDGVLYYTDLRPTENEVHSMNKTFKIVFNKARGALMVANELTGSVQKKGTTLIVASAVSLLCLGTASAGDSVYRIGNISIDGASITTDLSNIGNMTIGKDGSNVLISENPTTHETFLLYPENSDEPNIKVVGKNITVNGSYRTIKGWSATSGSNVKSLTLSIGNENTDSITLTSTIDSADSEFAEGTLLAIEDGTSVTLTAKNIGIQTVGNFGVQVGSNDENVQRAPTHAVVNLNADTISITNNASSEGVGIGTYSNGEMNIVGDLSVSAERVMEVRGHSLTNINQNSDHTAQLKGDIAFATPHTPIDHHNSGKKIDAEVNLNLTGSSSFWTGRSYMEYGVDSGETDEKGKTIYIPTKSIGLQGDPTYYGNVTGFNLSISNGATWNVTGDSLVNILTLNEGGNIFVSKDATLRVGTWDSTNSKATGNFISVDGLGNQLVLATGATLDSKLKIASGAELITNLDTAFTGASVSNETLTLGTVKARLSFVDSEKGTLSISDKFTYTGTDLTSLSTIYNGQVGLNFANATLDLEDNINIDTPITTGTISGNKNVEIREGGSLTLTGNNETSNIDTVTLNAGTTLSANNNTTVKIDTLQSDTGGVVIVGKRNGTSAHMSVNKLAMNGGSIFVDPYYGESTLAVASLSGGLNTNVTAGTGALVAFGTDVASAKNAVAKLDGFNSLESVVYVGTNMTLGASGSIVIKPLATAADETHAKKVYVASNGGLVIDQSAVGSNTVFAGAKKVTFEGGKLGITNATVGTITLTDAEEPVVEDITTATTDNPFIEAAVDGNTVVNTMSAEGGLGVLASTGIQAMTRRADTVLAQTIADRTSVDQELAAGTNLWVDVTGERYEADKLDNGGEFKSDMGYGAFGADFAVTQDITAGAAFQYGKGTLRSGVSSIKNSIDSYGVTAYGAMKFGEAKVVAEASYIKNENDITSSQTALNQSVDSEIYSVGVRGQHRFTAGNFQFVPSVGVRVSRLNTDAMQVGAVNIKKQEQTLVQVPIALRVNGFEQNVSGWSVAPSFKVAYVPTFGDKEISVFGADQTVIDTSPVQGDFGIRAQNGNLMVNANMMLGGGKDGTSSVGGKVGLKYVF